MAIIVIVSCCWLGLDEPSLRQLLMLHALQGQDKEVRMGLEGLESEYCHKTVPGLGDLAKGEVLSQVTGEPLEGKPKGR